MAGLHKHVWPVVVFFEHVLGSSQHLEIVFAMKTADQLAAQWYYVVNLIKLSSMQAQHMGGVVNSPYLYLVGPSRCRLELASAMAHIAGAELRCVVLPPR